jgi:hypothetical protein
MPIKKNCYLLSNPSACFSYTKNFINENTYTNVILPKNLQKQDLENLLLKEKGFIENINISNFSSFIKSFYSSYFKKNDLIDQVFLSEKLVNEGVEEGKVRKFINTILKLREARFNSEDLREFLDLNRSMYKELLDVFKKYLNILKEHKFKDMFDLSSFFIDSLSSLDKSFFDKEFNLLLVGFTEFSLIELEILKELSKHALNVSIIMPDIFKVNNDYVRVLKENLQSIGFSFENINLEEKEKKAYELLNKKEEVKLVLEKEKKASVFCLNSVDVYYSLFSYLSKSKSVSISSAVRLDKSRVLKFLILLMKLRSSKTFENIENLFDYGFLFNDLNLKKLIYYLKENNLFLDDFKNWKKLLEIKKEEYEVSNFLFVLEEIEKIPQTINKDFLKHLENLVLKLKIIENLNEKEKSELADCYNLINRVLKTTCSNLPLESFIEKLLSHAEENYISKLEDLIPDIKIYPISNICGPKDENVCLLGLNDEDIIQIKNEDIILNDDLTLRLRSHNFLMPTGEEFFQIQESLINDASKYSNLTYDKRFGDPFYKLDKSKFIKDHKFLEDELKSETIYKTLKIKDYKRKNLSPSFLESYIECPYKTFLQKDIKIDTDKHKRFYYSPMLEGNIFHKILEVLVTKEVKKDKYDIESEAKKILKDIEKNNFLGLLNYDEFYFSYVLEKITKFFKHHKKFLESVQSTSGEKKLNCFIGIENGRLDFSIDEKKGYMPFVAIVDRIDFLKDGNTFVIDYKRSSIPNQKNINEGKKIQVPTYILVSGLKLDRNISGGFYLSILGEDKIVGFNLKNSSSNYYKFSDEKKVTTDLDGIKKAISTYGVDAFNGIKEGCFNPKPLSLSECNKCFFKRYCTID